MKIRNFFYILMCGLLCNSYISASLADLNNDMIGTAISVLNEFKKIVENSEEKFGCDGSWTELRGFKSIDDIAQLNSNHYSDIRNQLSDSALRNKLTDVNNTSIFSNQRITQTLEYLYIYAQNHSILNHEKIVLSSKNKKSIILDPLLERIFEFNKQLRTDFNTLQREKEILMYQVENQKSSIFKYRIFGGISFLICVSLVTYVFLKSK